MRDITYMVNESGTPALAINHEYIKNILHQLLFLKQKDPYSDRGVNLKEARYKSLSDVQYLIPVITRNLEKYTDFYPSLVEFRMYGEVLVLVMTIHYQEQIINISIDPDTENIGILPV